MVSNLEESTNKVKVRVNKPYQNIIELWLSIFKLKGKNCSFSWYFLTSKKKKPTLSLHFWCTGEKHTPFSRLNSAPYKRLGEIQQDCSGVNFKGKVSTRHLSWAWGPVWHCHALMRYRVGQQLPALYFRLSFLLGKGLNVGHSVGLCFGQIARTGDQRVKSVPFSSKQSVPCMTISSE